MLRKTLLSRFNRVAIIGGGTMGGGIAQVTAQASIPVTVVDVDAAACERSKKEIVKSLQRVAKKKHENDAKAAESYVNDIVSRISFTSKAEEAAAESDLVIEAITEKLNAKNKLWQSIDSAASKECIFASNTSSLSIDAQAAVTKRADRFGGLHFFSPVPMMKLVEIVKGEKTSDETITKLNEYTKKIGKTPVICTDTKGFIVNRLLVPYMLESARLVERGVATVEDVDTAMRLGAGYPMGPFTLCDSVGIDVIKLITDAWHKEEPDNALFFPVKSIDEKVAQGKLGRKTGEGFYKYTK
jgi:3-hydroxyacyl-CoA dehydrogenase